MSVRVGNTVISGTPDLTEINQQLSLLSPYTTNRIIEIPQDIKLELNSGTLKVKAESNVRVPNGVGVFDEITTTQDSTVSFPGQTPDCLIFRHPNGGFIVVSKSQCFSGESAPSGQTYMMWLDTNNGLMKFTSDSGSTWTSGYSLPLGICQAGASNFTSIDQIFNGFGYIGSTVFALPGVKVQIPNGRNEDRSYKNIIRTLEQVLIIKNDYYVSISYTNPNIGAFIAPDDSGNIIAACDVKTGGYRYFDADRNSWVYYNDNSAQVTIKIANIPFVNGKISTFQPLNVDSIANSNASNFSQAGRSYLSGLGATTPSKYNSVTLLASGQPYTAPANGYFTISAQAPNVGTYVGFYNGCFIGQVSSQANQYVRITTPLIKKGNSVYLEYTAGITIQSFVFFYADGEV